MISYELDDYLNWLCDIVTDEDHQGYEKLYCYLFEKPFTWIVKMDENRAGCGIYLRTLYTDQTGKRLDILDGAPCNVLEMMIALSVDCGENVLWDGVNNWTPFIFWTMIDNLGLIDCVNTNFDKDYVDERIRIFLERDYSDDGVGGLFLPSQKNPKSQKRWRNLEIWYQMHEWIGENFE